MFENKVIIITGSTQGIGLTTAEMLARRGAKIVVNSRSSDKVEAACKHLKKISPYIVGIAGDVSNYQFCSELRDFAISQFGQIDILINNAGVASGGALSKMKYTHFEKVVNINLLGSVYPTLACVNDIRKQKGSILFLGSVAGIVGIPSYTAYCATKKAIVGLAESLKNELSDDGVFVGVNYPGFTENDATKTIINANGEEEILKKREGVQVVSREKTCGRIIKQLEKRKFRVYSSFSAAFVQWGYRFLPRITLKVLWWNRNKIAEMQ